ncbi:MAG: hypothetical protein HY289_00500 [Planctomycetes bacterium]|nr:hypothetical protein [Planctomycetota bacterium]
MPIPLVCPGCKQKLSAPEGSSGQRIRCPKCKSVIAVPEEELVTPEEEQVEPDESVGAFDITPAGSLKPLAEKPRHADADDDGGGYGLDEGDAEERRRRNRQLERDRHDDADVREITRRRSTQEHRGVLVMVLGILALFMSGCALIGFILAIVTLNMANEDLPKMERGVMDPTGYGMTMAGKVCAYVAVFFGFISIIVTIASCVARARI